MTKTGDPDPIPQVPLSRERILRAAIDLVDKGGIDALSMRKLAQELGVKAMSLYNRVADKSDILAGIVDIVIGEIEVPDLLIDWKTAMRRRANSAHEVLLRHPWAAMAIMSGINVGPASLRYVDATLGCLLEAGFSHEIADRAWNAIDSHIYGFTLQELKFPFDPEDYSEAAANWISMIPADLYPYMNQISLKVIDGSYDGIADFEFGLELILDGLESILNGLD